MFPLVYDELRRLARTYLARERNAQTLQPTALVHEAYLRLLGDEPVTWENRTHFFSAAAEAMRRILIDRARRRMRQRHGGGQARISLDEEFFHSEPDPELLLAVDEALSRLARHDAGMAEVVKLRYYGGLTVEELAECLGSSPRSINRQWYGARAWLQREMTRIGATSG